MKPRFILALLGVTLAFVLAPITAALAAGGPAVTVRVEGKTKTLLMPTIVKTHTGWVTRGGAPTGACPATSGAGALDLATKHHWSGPYKSSFGDYELNSIFGETHTFKSHFYWSIWFDNKYAQTGACGLKLHPHEQLLFTVEPTTGYWYPLAISAPAHAKVGHVFTVTVVWFNTAGKRKPLAGAHVAGGVTDSHGKLHILPTKKGKFVLGATKAGFIRAVPASVSVTS